MSNDPRKPKIVAADICPGCGSQDVDEVERCEGVPWTKCYMVCNVCDAEWAQYATGELTYDLIEYDGQKYPIPPSAEDRLRESAPALRDCLRRTLATVMASHRFGARQEIEDDILKTLRDGGDPYPYAATFGMVCPCCGSERGFCDRTEPRGGGVDAAHITCHACSREYVVLDRDDEAFAVEVDGVIVYSKGESTHV